LIQKNTNKEGSKGGGKMQVKTGKKKEFQKKKKKKEWVTPRPTKTARSD